MLYMKKCKCEKTKDDDGNNINDENKDKKPYYLDSPCRKFGQEIDSYIFNSKLIDSEGNPLIETGPKDRESVKLEPYIEFKEFSDLTEITNIKSMCFKALIFAVGILNRRLNGIIYFGIHDEGKIIKGCKISEDGNDISNVQEKIIQIFDQVLKGVFNAKNKCVLMAVENCICSPRFIKLTKNIEYAKTNTSINNLFVIEIEVESKMKYITSKMFFMTPKNEKSKHFFYIRHGSSSQPLDNMELETYKEQLISISKNRKNKDIVNKACLQNNYKIKFRGLGKKLLKFLEGYNDNNFSWILVLDKVIGKKFKFIRSIKWKLVLDLNSDDFLSNKFIKQSSLNVQIAIDKIEDLINNSRTLEKNNWIFVNGYDAELIKVLKHNEWTEKRSKLLRTFIYSITYLKNDRAKVLFIINDDEEGILSEIYNYFAIFLNDLFAICYIASDELKLTKLKKKMAYNSDAIDEKKYGIVGLPWNHVEHVFKYIKGEYDNKSLIPLSSSIYSPIYSDHLPDLSILSPNIRNNLMYYRELEKITYDDLIYDLLLRTLVFLVYDNFNYKLDLDNFAIPDTLIDKDELDVIKKIPTYKELKEFVKISRKYIEFDYLSDNKILKFYYNDKMNFEAKTLLKYVLLNFSKTCKCAIIKNITKNTERQIYNFLSYEEESINMFIKNPIILLIYTPFLEISDFINKFINNKIIFIVCEPKACYANKHSYISLNENEVLKLEPFKFYPYTKFLKLSVNIIILYLN